MCVAAFGEGTKLAVMQAVQPGLSAGARWALAGRPGAFAVSLAVLHLGAEWTSLRDRTFLGRIWLAALTLTLATAGGTIAPLAFIGLVVAAVLWTAAPRGVHASSGAATIVGSTRT